VTTVPRAQLPAARTWDAMETLLSTAQKTGSDFLSNTFRNRVSGADADALPLAGDLESTTIAKRWNLRSFVATYLTRPPDL